ncbi:hypothetical protein K5D33_07495 [Pseudomonas cichorii]|nr:hypothetical protein [Pseudomonas cichorii]MBX8534568.1 hypothetical protein [Pseudomonas cichorii]
MSLRDQGFKFCISPDKKRSRWLHPTEFKVMYADWIDVTDWSGEKLLEYLMPAPEQRDLFDA